MSVKNFSKIKVAIDLTPLQPGGVNGGAKTLVITLLKLFALIRSEEFHYLLISEPWNYEELLEFEGPNITCLLKSDIYNSSKPVQLTELSTLDSQPGPLADTPFKASFFWKKLKRKIKHASRKAIKSVICGIQLLLRREELWFIRAKNFIKRKLLSKTSFSSLLDIASEPINQVSLSPKDSPPVLQEVYGIDLLFCPFSSPHLAERGLPLVAVFYDLQHIEFPYFFAAEERIHRDRFLRNLVHQANRIICISDFSRQSLFKNFDAEENQLISIPICIHERLTPSAGSDGVNALAQLGLEENNYLFFPANFWPHKNHRMLLAAYSIYRHQYPDLAIDLVFTGALEAPQNELREMAAYLGCADNVHFLGFLSEEELIALWQGCRGLVFPSLYEGFGIPVLEAMWFDKPVACSHLGSLPEVGGDAVIYFDPRQPEAIAQAIAQLAHDPELTTRLRERAQQHLKQFSQQTMAEQYLDVFQDVVTAAKLSVSTP